MQSKNTRRKIIRDNEGTTALEFAMITPVFMLIMMGIIEFSLVMFTQAIMESATGNTARTGKTGYSEGQLSREQQLINSVATRTSALLDPTKLTVSMRVYPSFDSVNDPEPYTDSNHNGMYNSGEPYTDVNGNGQWDNDMASAGAGNANDIVVYTVSYPWRIMTPILSNIMGTTYNVSARAVVKNEPW